jgi:TP901 family phage tail tape measure protein
MAFKPIQIVINAKDNASAVLGRLEKSVKAVGLAVAGYFGIKAFAGGIQGAADFEAAMSRVKAATDGSAQEMAALTKAAQDAGSSTKYTSVEAAGALENLAKAGLSAADSIKALPAVLALAQAGDIELGTASEYLTKAVMGMGLAFDDAARVADVLALGANATNTSVEGLAQALSYAAPVANSLGVSLESTVAIIGKFADAGIDASRAGTALNSIMSQFANPASKFRQELGAAGIVTTDFDKALRQLAASGPAGEKAINAVGLEAGPALRSLLNQGMGALDGLTESLHNAKGSADAAARTMSDNLKGALTGLGSVWDSVVIALNTPVLPVLKEGVDALAGSLRRLIDDGSVARMGEVLASAFDSGIKGVQNFLGALNVDQIILRMQVIGSEVGETFQRITTFATNAGNAVRMAWGVMTAGTHAVMAVIYKVGEAFAGVASNVQSGVALIMDGLSLITFGGVSASFKQAAEEIRLSAEATWASSQALAEKADDSFNSMADSAQMARDGWDGLTGAVEQTNKVLPTLGKTVQEVAAQIEASGQAAAKAKVAVEAKAESDRKAAESVKRLKQEYEELIRSGNLQGAAKRLLEIDRAQQQLSKSAGKAQETADLLEQAYKNLGLTSNAELKKAADAARESFALLAKDGTQPPQRIAEAWKVMADRVIAANGGIAPSWLKTEAAVKGYEIAVDKAGKSVASTEKATLRATGSMAKGFRDLGDAADDADRRMQRVGGGNKPDRPDRHQHNGPDRKPDVDREPDDDNKPDYDRKPPPGRKRPYIPKGPHKPFANSSVSTVGKSQTNSIQDLVPVFETEAQLDAWWKEWQRQYKEQNPFDTKSRGQLGNYMYDTTKFAMEGARKQIKLQQAANSAIPKQPAQAGSQEPAVNTAQQLVQTHRHEISFGGRELGAIQTDEAGSNVLQSLLGELERSARLTGAAV